ncbi:MAG: hypothetical protein JW763_10045 [candidate division Zixibacteria bacterium]|nr:hypothetical protein [candidate division Zixibacteria bacterium]
MKTIPDKPGTVLQWQRLKGTSCITYELYHENDPVARLYWTKPLGSLAIGESANGKWTFKRIGFFATPVSIRKEDAVSDFGLFNPNWKGDGYVTLEGGKTFYWKSNSFWKSNVILTDDAGNAVLTMNHNGTASLEMAQIITGSSKTDSATLTLLAILAIYVGVLAMQDDGASLAAIIAAVIS